MDYRITLPADPDTIRKLRAGDYVYFSGTIYTARDAAHARMMKTLDEGKELPFPIEGSAVYYMGPTPAAQGQVIGSAGPTTASRMDRYTPRLLDLGMKVMIGKGKRSREVADAIMRNGAVYLAAVGGAGALLSRCIRKAEVIAYEELGTEAIRKLEIADFPAIVVMDCRGGDLYTTAVAQYCTLDDQYV